MGVATFTQQQDPIPLGGTARLVIGTVTMSSSYATGGDTLDFEGDLNPKDGRVILAAAGGRVPEWDGANGKVLVYQDNAAAAAAALGQVANATNLSTVVFEAWAILTT